MRSITCDQCDARLDLEPWHIALDNRRMPIKLGEPPQQQPLEREHHFCSLDCLKQWITDA